MEGYTNLAITCSLFASKLDERGGHLSIEMFCASVCCFCNKNGARILLVLTNLRMQPEDKD